VAAGTPCTAPIPCCASWRMGGSIRRTGRRTSWKPWVRPSPPIPRSTDIMSMSPTPGARTRSQRMSSRSTPSTRSISAKRRCRSRRCSAPSLGGVPIASSSQNGKSAITRFSMSARSAHPGQFGAARRDRHADAAFGARRA
jgi:hypothetical protein